jgi:hypothetical protein
MAKSFALLNPCTRRALALDTELLSKAVRSSPKLKPAVLLLASVALIAPDLAALSLAPLSVPSPQKKFSSQNKISILNLDGLATWKVRLSLKCRDGLFCFC